MTLEHYFHLIINQPRIVEFKEKSMFEEFKAKMTAWFTHTWEFKEEPAQKEETVEEDFEEGWAFVMRDSSFEDTPMRETSIAGNNDGTWMETVDQLLDVIGAHYGYNIKEQVYYSVHMPLNIEGEAGFGRCLNDEVLQKLLLSYPEAYDFKGHIEQ